MPFNHKIVYAVSSAKNNQDTFIDIVNKILSTEEYEKYLNELAEISQNWLFQRSELLLNFKQFGIPTDFKTIQNYCKGVEGESIIVNLNYYKINGNNVALEKIPGSRIMLYSQYNRVHLSKKDIKVNDVMDVQLTCIAPYMDIIYTEVYQADIYKKSKKFIPQMKDIEILTLRDLK